MPPAIQGQVYTYGGKVSAALEHADRDTLDDLGRQVSTHYPCGSSLWSWCEPTCPPSTTALVYDRQYKPRHLFSCVPALCPQHASVKQQLAAAANLRRSMEDTARQQVASDNMQQLKMEHKRIKCIQVLQTARGVAKTPAVQASLNAPVNATATNQAMDPKFSTLQCATQVDEHAM